MKKQLTKVGKETQRNIEKNGMQFRQAETKLHYSKRHATIIHLLKTLELNTLTDETRKALLIELARHIVKSYVQTIANKTAQELFTEMANEPILNMSKDYVISINGESFDVVNDSENVLADYGKKHECTCLIDDVYNVLNTARVNSWFDVYGLVDDSGETVIEPMTIEIERLTRHKIQFGHDAKIQKKTVTVKNACSKAMNDFIETERQHVNEYSVDSESFNDSLLVNGKAENIAVCNAVSFTDEQLMILDSIASEIGVVNSADMFIYALYAYNISRSVIEKMYKERYGKSTNTVAVKKAIERVEKKLSAYGGTESLFASLLNMYGKKERDDFSEIESLMRSEYGCRF